MLLSGHSYRRDRSSRRRSPPGEITAAILLLVLIGGACGMDTAGARRSTATVSFPRQVGSRTTDEALLVGELVLDDCGCLRVDAREPVGSFLLVWPAEYSPSTVDGTTRILDETRRVVARVGDIVGVGGGAIESPNRPDRRYVTDLTETCSGPWWIVGAFSAAPPGSGASSER